MAGIVRIEKEEGEHSSESHVPPPEERLTMQQVDSICNPAYYALIRALKDFHESPSVEIVEAIHEIMLVDGSQTNKHMLDLLPQTYAYLDRPELYSRLCVLLSDVSHHNQYIVDSLLKFGIFGKLDYREDSTYHLVFAICSTDKKAWEAFREDYLRDDMCGNPRIQTLRKFYGE